MDQVLVMSEEEQNQMLAQMQAMQLELQESRNREQHQQNQLQQAEPMLQHNNQRHDGPRDDPMEIEGQLQHLQQLAVRPKVPYKLELYVPGKGEKHDIDQFIIKFELMGMLQGLNTNDLKLGYIPLYGRGMPI